MSQRNHSRGYVAMDYSRLTGVFDPPSVPVHIIGCGATGSHVAVELAKMGVKELHLWDFDTIEEHNLANQLFRKGQVGSNKALALKSICSDFNPCISITPHPYKCTGEQLKHIGGYVFLAVDTFKSRAQIAKGLAFSGKFVWVFDTRMGVRDCTLYSFNPRNRGHLLRWIPTIGDDNSTDIERSPCGTALTVGVTASTIADMAIWTFIDHCMGTAKHACEKHFCCSPMGSLEDIW